MATWLSVARRARALGRRRVAAADWMPHRDARLSWRGGGAQAQSEKESCGSLDEADFQNVGAEHWEDSRRRWTSHGSLDSSGTSIAWSMQFRPARSGSAHRRGFHAETVSESTLARLFKGEQMTSASPCLGSPTAQAELRIPLRFVVAAADRRWAEDTKATKKGQGRRRDDLRLK
mmetsp:Transcript_58523/g.137071  ORF Transcript_58523/g.137071 Transcript_58523/m.137071 type:complete len:175 (+) Transcript_58523:56-580(+)